VAVYKVIQDIESEDKIVGPLTLKGFIYAAAAAVFIFIDVRILIGGLPGWVKILFTLTFLPPTMLFATLASPLGREQPTEVWLLSHIRFLFKARTRQWDQNGMKQLVRVTAPQKLERVLTKNISQTEVVSRLKGLANTLDSRGWAIKNSSVNLASPAQTMPPEADDDRLAAPVTIAQDNPVLDVHPEDDILDEQNNPMAKNVDSLMQQAENQKQQNIAEAMEDARSSAPAPSGPAREVIIPADLTAEEKALLDEIHRENTSLNMHPPIIRGGAEPVTDASQTAKLELAKAGNALSVATIAKLANRAPLGSSEVDIELH